MPTGDANAAVDEKSNLTQAQSSISFLGIAWEENRLRVVQVKEEGDDLTVFAVEEVELDRAFAPELLGDLRFVDQLAKAVRPVVANLPARPDGVGFALSHDAVTIKLLLVDANLPEEEKEAFVRWEIARRMGGKSEDHILDLYPLQSRLPRFDEIVVVVLRPRLQDFFLSLGDTLRVPVTVLDVDIFAGQGTVVYNYPSLMDGRVAVVKRREATYDLSLLERGEFGYHSTFRILEDGRVALLGQTASHSIGERLLEDFSALAVAGEEPKFDGVDSILIYGDATDSRLFIALREHFDDERPVIVDPFARLSLDAPVNTEVLSTRRDRFTEAVGVAVHGVFS